MDEEQLRKLLGTLASEGLMTLPDGTDINSFMSSDRGQSLLGGLAAPEKPNPTEILREYIVDGIVNPRVTGRRSVSPADVSKQNGTLNAPPIGGSQLSSWQGPHSWEAPPQSSADNPYLTALSNVGVTSVNTPAENRSILEALTRDRIQNRPNRGVGTVVQVETPDGEILSQRQNPFGAVSADGENTIFQTLTQANQGDNTPGPMEMRQDGTRVAPPTVTKTPDGRTIVSGQYGTVVNSGTTVADVINDEDESPEAAAWRTNFLRGYTA